MGLDFIRKTAPSFSQMLDRRAIELRTPTLFSHDAPIVLRTASADIFPGAKIAIGEKVLIRIVKGKVVLQRDNLVIAECPKPPAEFVSHLLAGAGIAEGEIKALQSLSQTLEFGICE